MKFMFRAKNLFFVCCFFHDFVYDIEVDMNERTLTYSSKTVLKSHLERLRFKEATFQMCVDIFMSFQCLSYFENEVKNMLKINILPYGEFVK